MSGGTENFPEWERALTAAARLQRQLPDADHVLPDLWRCFDKVLTQLESVAGLTTARVRAPVPIVGSLDGIETGIRQLVRSEPLETAVAERDGLRIVVPTEAEILRIKGVLILRRNAMRDYLDFVALASRMTTEEMVSAMWPFDDLYPQDSGQSAIQQLQAQLANALPFDLDASGPETYRGLVPELQDWERVRKACAEIGQQMFDGLCNTPLHGSRSPSDPEFDL